nr:hypothetical protein [Flavihumibacter rivuli]
MHEQNISVNRACKIVSFPLSQFCYTSKMNEQDVVDALQEIAFIHSSEPANLCLTDEQDIN